MLASFTHPTFVDGLTVVLITYLIILIIAAICDGGPGDDGMNSDEPFV